MWGQPPSAVRPSAARLYSLLMKVPDGSRDLECYGDVTTVTQGTLLLWF
jgi:hypothetical protein